MFATLIGPWPVDDTSGTAVDPAPRPAPDRVRAIVAELEAAGLEPLVDGAGSRAGDPAEIVAAWRLAATATERPVKQALLGPYSRAEAGEDVSSATEDLRATIVALAEAGCPMVEIDEPAAASIGAGRTEWARFLDLQSRLTDELDAPHLSLVMTGGNVDAVDPEDLFRLPYASFAFDLVAGPDNWRLIARAPGDRGIVCGALSPVADSDDRPDLLVWAAHYAASTGGRGLVRVGLANASSLASLSADRARRKMAALVEAARIAESRSTAEMAAQLDPRAIDSRTAALGRVVPKPPRRPTRARPPRARPPRRPGT